MSTQKIQEQVLFTYERNMRYLEEFHLDLYKMISLFEAGLNSGDIKEKYQLDYKEEYFDILNLDNNSYLYNQKFHVDNARSL